jgi:hypothetical protein
MREKPRSDIGSKRGSYTNHYDTTAKQTSENGAHRSFWRKHKVKDLVDKTPEEIDKLIDAWIIDFEKKALKRNKSWWYPILDRRTVTQARYKKKVDN